MRQRPAPEAMPPSDEPDLQQVTAVRPLPAGNREGASRVSWRGLLLAIALISAFYTVAGVLSPDRQTGVQAVFGLGLNAGVVQALALLPSRRQYPLFLLTVTGFTVLIRLTDPVLVNLLIAAANVCALVAYRALAMRFAAGGRRLDSGRCLARLLGCQLAAVLIANLLIFAELRVATDAHWLSAATIPSTGFLLAIRPAAQADGLVTIAPLLLLLTRRRPGSWPRASWLEIGAWLVLMITIAAATSWVTERSTTAPLLLLVTYAALVFPVLRHGILAAAVITPAFAVAAASVLLHSEPDDPAAASRILVAQAAGFLAAILVWATAIVVTQRDVARTSAQSRDAAQAALSDLQHSLLPPEVVSGEQLQVAARYQASTNRIGGDWYDTITLPGGGVALVIGDVEGHDLKAASVMGLVRGAVRSAALEGHPPSIVLDRAHRFLASAGYERLVTIGYLQLHPHDGTATVAVAGHPVPVLVCAEEGIRPLPARAGPILGVEGLTGWPEQTVVLPPQAMLVLYTDGLTDVPERWSRASLEQRLAELTVPAAGRAAETPESPDRLADRLIATAAPYDDAAVLVARLTTPAALPAHRTFPAQTINARLARIWLADLLQIWQARGALPASVGTSSVPDVAQLLVTELVSNAVRHTDTAFTVRLGLAGERLRVEVEDNSERMPIMRHPEKAATEGRGLRLVDAMASAWGVTVESQGKTVWFELALNTPDDLTDDVDEAAVLAHYADKPTTGIA